MTDEAYKVAIRLVNHQFGVSVNSLGCTLDEFAAQARQQTINEVLEILDDEGWLGESKQRITRLAAALAPPRHPHQKER